MFGDVFRGFEGGRGGNDEMIRDGERVCVLVHMLYMYMYLHEIGNTT